MLAYHMLSPALSVEETGLMAYLQTPPEAGPIYSSSDVWPSELEMRRKEISRDRRETVPETSHSHSTTSVIHQDTLKAFGSKQEIELHAPAAVEHYTNDESKSDRDRGSLCTR